MVWLTNHEEVFIDGTKIESKANRYTFVWRKVVEQQLKKIKSTVKEMLHLAVVALVTEDEETGQKKFSPQVMYVNAEDTKEADELLRDHMDDSQMDWEIKSIAETKVLAVLEYK